MKSLFALILLAASTAVFAGDYYGPGQIDTYDPATGLYFKAVLKNPDNQGLLGSKSGGGPVTINISVFDPATGASRHLFNRPVGGFISDVLFETGFKDGSIEFSGQATSRVKNNTAIEKREPRTRVLVAVRNPERKETVLLATDKRAGNLAPVATVPFASDWHIDVRNSRLRIVHQTGQGIRIESHEW